MHVLADLLALCFHDRAHEAINGGRRNGGFHHEDGSLGAHLQHFAHRCRHIARIRLFGAVIVGRRHRNNVNVCRKILSLEADARIQRLVEQLFQAFFLKGQLASVQ